MREGYFTKKSRLKKGGPLMLKFPVTIKDEKEVTPTLIRELCVILGKNMTRGDGDYLEAMFKFQGDVWLKVHEGKIKMGSKASLEFVRDKLWINVGE
jgi:hypothetical protein